jgi:hypothetical protein
LCLGEAICEPLKGCFQFLHLELQLFSFSEKNEVRTWLPANSIVNSIANMHGVLVGEISTSIFPFLWIVWFMGMAIAWNSPCECLFSFLWTVWFMGMTLAWNSPCECSFSFLWIYDLWEWQEPEIHHVNAYFSFFWTALFEKAMCVALVWMCELKH